MNHRPTNPRTGKEHVDWSAATDEQLIEAVQRRNEPAFAVLVRRYEAELFHYLNRYVGDRSLADDVFQNTFLQVYLKRDLFEPGKRFKPWLYAVATNQAIDAMRRAGRQTRLSLEQGAGLEVDGESVSVADLLPAAGPSPVDQAEAEELRGRVREAVDALPEHFRQVILLAYFQRLKYKEVADVLGIPVGTVKSRLFAAVQLLQSKWAGQPAGPVGE